MAVASLVHLPGECVVPSYVVAQCVSEHMRVIHIVVVGVIVVVIVPRQYILLVQDTALIVFDLIAGP